MALTEDAKKEIAEAIRIVREDRFEAYVRSRVPAPKEDPKDELITKDDPKKDDPPNPPPPKDEPKNDPPNDPPPTRKSSYWGEILD